MGTEHPYWTRAARRRISRRSVLRGAFGVASFAWAAGVVGCTSPTQTSTPGRAATASSPAAIGTGAAGSGATTVGGKQILYAKFLSNPQDFAAQPKAGGHLSIATNY